MEGKETQRRLRTAGRRRNADGTNTPRGAGMAMTQTFAIFWLSPDRLRQNRNFGQEMASEGEALIEAFRTGQPFYTLTAWKAVPEVNGGSPVIVKQAVAQKTI